MVKLGTSIHFFFAILLFGSLFTANPWLTAYGVLVLFLILRMVWVAFAPAVLLFCLFYQWMQSFARVIQANLAGMQVNLFDNSPSAGLAVSISLTAVLLITLLLNRFLKRFSFSWDRMRKYLGEISQSRVILLWTFFFALNPLLNSLRIGGLSQIIIPLLSIKWILFCLLFLIVLAQRKGWISIGAIFGIELILGFTGFFSEFKVVIFYALIIGMSVIQSISFRNFIFALIFGSVLVPLALFWTSIKADYRGFANQGLQAQVVLVSRSEAIAYIGKKLSNFDAQAALSSTDPLLSRLQYTQMIQYAIDYVPSRISHENGELWKAAVGHILMPRVLFPNKAPLDDSEIASRYTGIQWAGALEGASIGLGYFGESYVDFGVMGMLFPIAAMAVLVGFIFSFFVSRHSPFWLLDYLATIPILINFDKIETSGTKLLGGLVMAFIVYLTIIRPFIFPAIWNFINNAKPYNMNNYRH